MRPHFGPHRRKLAASARPGFCMVCRARPIPLSSKPVATAIRKGARFTCRATACQRGWQRACSRDYKLARRLRAGPTGMIVRTLEQMHAEARRRADAIFESLLAAVGNQ